MPARKQADQAQEHQPPNKLVERTLQQDEEQQESHRRHPAPARVSPYRALQQVDYQRRQPGKQEIAAIIGMPDTKMGHHVAVKAEQDCQYGKSDRGKAVLAPEPQQTNKTERVKEPGADQYVLAYIQPQQQDHLRRQDHIWQGHVTVGHIAQSRTIRHVQRKLTGLDGILHKGDARSGNLSPIQPVEWDSAPVEQLAP